MANLNEANIASPQPFAIDLEDELTPRATRQYLRVIPVISGVVDARPGLEATLELLDRGALKRGVCCCGAAGRADEDMKSRQLLNGRVCGCGAGK